jgi:hypothetical protein
MTLPEDLLELRGALPAIARLHVCLEAVAPVRLPGWTGSTLHGAIGRALRSLTCSPSCSARHADESNRCPYAIFCEPPAAPRPLSGHVRAMPAPALALRPPAPGRARALQPGELWSFDLILIGEHAMQRTRALLAALAEMAEHGLGRGRGRLRLSSARSGGVELWRNGHVLGAPSRIEPEIWANVTAPGSVELHTVTPLALARRKALIERPSAPDLIIAALRRLVALSGFHGRREPDLQIAALSERLASQVTDELASWEPFETERYSSRQRRRHAVRGVLGEIHVDGAGSFAPLLAWTAEVGFGKGTAMGLGAVDVRVQPREEVESAPEPAAEPVAEPIPRPAPVVSRAGNASASEWSQP